MAPKNRKKRRPTRRIFKFLGLLLALSFGTVGFKPPSPHLKDEKIITKNDTSVIYYSHIVSHKIEKRINY